MYSNSQEDSLEHAIIRSPLTISASATVADAIAMMSVGSQTCDLLCEIDSEINLQLAHARNSCILVTEGKKLIGILTERDLIKLCGQNAHLDNSDQNSDQNLDLNLSQNLTCNLIETAIFEVMTYPVQSLLEWEFTDILVPINRFHRYNFRHLPLVNDHGEVVGLLTYESLRQLLRPVDMLRLRQVREVMITKVVYAPPTTSVAKVVNLMLAQKVSSVVIAEDCGNGLCPLGIVAESDIVQYLALELDLVTTPVKIVMNFPVATVSRDETLWTVRETMQKRMVNHLIVTNADGQMEGIIAQSDLLKTLQPNEIYRLVSFLESKMSRLEQEKLELLQNQNKLLESQVQERTSALADSNDMFRQFADHNRAVIVIREARSNKVVYVSPRYSEIWGQPSENLYQNPDIWMQSIHPEDIDRINQAHALTADSGAFSEEYRIVRPDGEIRWIWGRCFPLKNAQGNIEQIAAVAEDISDRKIAAIALQQSEQRLRASESLLSAMFERSVVGMAITDANGRFVRANPFYQQMVGYSESELQLMRFTDNMLPEDIEDNLKLRTQVLSGESEGYQMEKRLLHRNGKMLWVRTTSSKILDEVGQPPLFVGVIEDISDRKQAEESLQSTEIERQEAIEALYQLNQQLESRVEQRTQELQFANQQLIETNAELARATKLKDEFLANMSHELRTPLNAILGMSEGLMTAVFGELNERQMRSLSLIETSGRHLLALINDILDVAKIGAGKLDLELSSVEVEYLCKSSLNFVKQVANQKNIQLKLAIAPNIPTVLVDERRMRQALINLLSNAVKFTPKNGRVSLEVKLQKIEASILSELTIECSYALVFSIIDTGIGISPTDISKLFQAFVQIDSSLNRQYAGTGLGLTLVKQIAELHGGSVNVTSQVGEGSCFTIVLPHRERVNLNNISSKHDVDDNHHCANNLDNSLENSSSINALILLADDNPSNIETFSNYLVSRGYRLIFATNGQEAIDMIIDQNPDLVLMDIQMPVLDGISAIAQIRANPNISHVPIVALTALAMEGDREKCLAVGANEYLTKPVKLSYLVKIIQQQLQKKRN